jgi:chromosome partitioning protein
MKHIIAVSNQKGGVAKTTTCLSLGACLAEMGNMVLLIDLDPQASLTLSLGIDPGSLRRTVADAVLQNATLVSISRETQVPGLDIVPSNPGLATIDKVLYRGQGYESYLKEALAELDQSLYDYVLIDCAPSFGPLVLNALTASDFMIVPIQAEYFAVKSLDNVFKLIELVRQRTNPGLRYRVLVTMYDRRNSICVRILEQIKAAFSHALFKTIIEIDTKLRESPVVAKPITLYQSDTRGALQYRALAEELMQYE